MWLFLIVPLLHLLATLCTTVHRTNRLSVPQNDRLSLLTVNTILEFPEELPVWLTRVNVEAWNGHSEKWKWKFPLSNQEGRTGKNFSLNRLNWTMMDIASRLSTSVVIIIGERDDTNACTERVRANWQKEEKTEERFRLDWQLPY